MTKTLEQLKAEAEVARLALEEAEKAARQAEREAKEELRKAEEEQKEVKRLEFRKDICRDIKAELEALGVGDIKVTEDFKSIVADRVSISIYGWSYVEKVIVGGAYGKGDTNYRPLKSGGFNYKGIAAKVKERADANAAAKKVAEEKALKATSSKELAKELCTELGVDDSRISGVIGQYHQIGWSGNRREWKETIAPEGKVYVKLGTYTVTPDEARKLIEALRSIGLQK